jgi:hypothetical protein
MGFNYPSLFDMKIQHKSDGQEENKHQNETEKRKT